MLSRKTGMQTDIVGLTLCPRGLAPSFQVIELLPHVRLAPHHSDSVAIRCGVHSCRCVSCCIQRSCCNCISSNRGLLGCRRKKSSDESRGFEQEEAGLESRQGLRGTQSVATFNPGNLCGHGMFDEAEEADGACGGLKADHHCQVVARGREA